MPAPRFRAFIREENKMCRVLAINFEKQEVELKYKNCIRRYKNFEEVLIMQALDIYDSTTWEQLEDTQFNDITAYAYYEHHNAEEKARRAYQSFHKEVRDYWKGKEIFEGDSIVVIDEYNNRHPFILKDIKSFYEFIYKNNFKNDVVYLEGNVFEKN